MKKVKLGIIGVGNMGFSHTKNLINGLVPNVEITAICDIDADKRKRIEDNFPTVQVYNSKEEMYEKSDIEAVIIATPHYDHPPIAIDAFKRGYHVLCEKPAGVYTKQVLEMNAEAEKHPELVFAVMYNQRTTDAYIKLKNLIDSGELGNIKRVNWTITNWYRSQAYHMSSDWRSTWKGEGGGALINQNPHQIDLWQWLFGMPDRIWAKTYNGKYHNIEVEDDVTAFFEYDNGMTGTYITSTGEAPGTNRLEIACDMGKIVVENSKLMYYRNTISEREYDRTTTVEFGMPEYWNCEIPTKAPNSAPHMAVIEAFANKILGTGELVANGLEGIKCVTIINGINYSSWTGETVDVNNFPHDGYLELLNEKIKNSKPKGEAPKAKGNVDMSGTF